MPGEGLDLRQIVIYWAEEAEEALTVAEHLYEKGDYSYGLFAKSALRSSLRRAWF